jgi:hypothetical protein
MSALHRLRQHISEWREDGGPPVWIVWNCGCRYWVIGGGRTRGWVLIPHVSIDLRHLTFGVYWQKEAFEDPDPLVSFHLPGLCMWTYVRPVPAGYRMRPRNPNPRIYARQVTR